MWAGVLVGFEWGLGGSTPFPKVECQLERGGPELGQSPQRV